MAETEGIVLSPQRRSFTAGCLVSKESTIKDSDREPINSISGTHSGIKLENLPSSKSMEREPASLSLRPDPISNQSRRVGSGRILSREPRGPGDYDHDQRGGDSRDRDRVDRDRDRGGFNESSSDRYGFGRNRDRDRDRNRDWNDRYDRGGGDFDGPPNRGDRSGDRGGRGGSRNDRGTSRNKNEPRGRGGGQHRDARYARDVAPEWMSEPVNQDETFDLRGFDDSPEKEVEKKKPNTTSSDSSSKTAANINDPGFNIDDILHMDVIPGNTK